MASLDKKFVFGNNKDINVRKNLNLFNFKKNVENNVPDKIQEHLRKFQEIHDKKENEQTTPPENEQINLRCIWVVEIYPPSHIKNLLSCIETYDWDDPVRGDVSKWIKEHRQGAYVSYFNLNYIRNTKTSTDRFAPMPEGFEGAFGAILQLIPSTTILILQFILNPEIERILEIPLNKEYKTYIEPDNKTYRLITPNHQKQSEVEKTRKLLYDKCYEWFKSNAPGIFSSGINDCFFPTIELTTLNLGKPCISSIKNLHSDYLKVIGLSKDSHVWECNELPGIFLKKKSEYEDYSKLLLSGNLFEITSNKDSVIRNCDNNIEIDSDFLINEIGFWALFIYIMAYKLELSKIRDKMVLIKFAPIDLAIKEMRQLEIIFIEIERDLPYFLFELSNFCTEEYFFQEFYKFKPINSWISINDYFENIRTKIINEIEYTRELQKNIREMINIISQNISTLSNERLAKTNISIQKWMIILAATNTILVISINWDFILQKFVDTYHWIASILNLA